MIHKPSTLCFSQSASAAGFLQQTEAYNLLFPTFGGKTFKITYLSNTVRLTTIEAQVIPIPAAAWLFASALAGLFAAARRRAARL